MKDEKKATRASYGEALAKLGEENKNIVVLDADLSGATKTNINENTIRLMTINQLIIYFFLSILFTSITTTR